MLYRCFFQQFFFLVILAVQTLAQPGSWEPIRSLPIGSSYEVGGVVADGYGQHVIATYSGSNPTTNSYFLFGNSGDLIWSQTLSLGGNWNSDHASICSHGGVLSIAIAAHLDANSNRIYLFQSTDGGATWPTIFQAFFNINVTPDFIDVFGDANGVHATWASETQVFYRRRLANQTDWTDITNLSTLPNGDMGKDPKVISTGTTVIVSYVGVPSSQVFTRDGTINSTPSGVDWETNVRATPQVTDFFPAAQSIAQLGNDFHLIIATEDRIPSPRSYLATATRLSSGSWSSPQSFATYGEDEFQNYRRKIVSYDNTLFSCFTYTPPLSARAIGFRYNTGTGWSTPENFDAGTDPRRSTLSTSQTGTYLFWVHGQSVNHWMVRQVRGLSGLLHENMFWTGNNWITGNASIENGVTVTMKSNSLTTFLSNAQLTVKNGATLIIEQNADPAMQSGSKILVENGGVVKVQQNATLTIPSGGTLQVSAGAQFKFSPWSGLLSYGQVNVYGTQSLPVTFQSIYGSGGTWNGITLSGSGANGSNFQYATVANVLTYWGSAVNILDASYVHVEHCTISSNASNGTNGLLLYNASDAMIGYNTINGNAGDGIRFDETGWANVYKNIIQGNANAGINCINSSLALGTYPFYSPDGNNVITGGNYGVIASWYSYPWMGSVGNTWVGYNSVCSNTSGRVYSSEYSIVGADVNWWGTDKPSGALFPTASGGIIEWEDYLGYDPNNACSDQSLKLVAGNGGGTINSMEDSSDVIVQALRERNNRNRGRAKGFLQAALNANPNATRGIQAATILMQMYRDSSDDDALDVMARLWRQRRANHPVFAHALAKMWLRKGMRTDGVALLNTIAGENPNSEYEKRALLTLFYSYFGSAESRWQAGEVLQRLQARYADDEQVKQAAWVYGTGSGSSSLGKIGLQQEAKVQPTTFALEQNYPNPFNPTTTIRFAIPQSEHVTLKVYDLLGREVATLVNEQRNAGSYDEIFDASKLASGMYLYKLQAGNFTASRKFVLMK